LLCKLIPVIFGSFLLNPLKYMVFEPKNALNNPVFKYYDKISKNIGNCHKIPHVSVSKHDESPDARPGNVDAGRAAGKIVGARPGVGSVHCSTAECLVKTPRPIIIDFSAQIQLLMLTFRSSLSRVRSWLRLAVMQKKLAEYFTELIEAKSLLRLIFMILLHSH